MGHNYTLVGSEAVILQVFSPGEVSRLYSTQRYYHTVYKFPSSSH